ncbi:hypothetical protein N0V88_005944 [Collariella sp. IMI 366227]|nr:hypothetical protein N0V88_005944 [Collariella sp. IMI 366227]
MSTSVPADAPAVSAPAQDEKPLKSPKVEVEEVSEPTETGKRDPHPRLLRRKRLVRAGPAPPPTTTTTTTTINPLDPTALLEGSSAAEDYNSAAFFNRRTGQWQTAEQGTERHSDEAKARRQMRAFFDVDAAANMHDGRSLKAERAGIKPSRSELKAFKERRKQRKEERRRAWLRD